ncbi:MAG: SGNH/GDSL hydrolase family protein [Erythrobacter sp.]|uniref:SGNH/GDSL hydrolase family protein n=1 Tax=Erythrobacter sp. TaxID=1042 RepID=UPI002611A18B|nr:SGNH/GDSL hydrolase family protein [Erythrobacter sp.]MDJ0979379.1 SGNH/GDSL hydrolase family protein [Erythrobacter sp.]
MKRRKWITVCFVLALAAMAALWPEVPAWTSGGTNSVKTRSVSYDGQIALDPEAATLVSVLGDSHVSGSLSEKGSLPFGRVLDEALGNQTTVKLYARGGDTAPMGEDRWADIERRADIVILAYGTNDAAPRGWLRARKPLEIAQFKASLTRHIEGWQRSGSQVLLLAPPPGGSAATARRLAPYRRAVASLGKIHNVPVIDPVDAFDRCEAGQPVLVLDALHMNADGHRCLGEWIARKLADRLATHGAPKG